MTEQNRWTDKHGPDKLYDKFRVLQISQGKFLPDDEFVIVLRPERDRAAYQALRRYADCVRGRSPNLAVEIHAKLDKVRDDNAVLKGVMP